MTPAHCRVKHDPPHSYGDCVRACVASLLDLPPEQVPHFYDNDASADDGYEAMRLWLRDRGYAPFVAMYGACPLDELLQAVGAHHPDVHYMLFGGTADGGDHVVVCRGDAVVHNPAWYGCALTGPGSHGYWQVMVLVRI